MLDLDAFREFREGLSLLREGQATGAVELLRHASQRDPENPYYMSYFGLSLGHAEGNGPRPNGSATPLCAAAAARPSCT